MKRVTCYCTTNPQQVEQTDFELHSMITDRLDVLCVYIRHIKGNKCN